ncbi:MAG: hypothetical protein V7K89_30405 [Nostoc sp.]
MPLDRVRLSAAGTLIYVAQRPPKGDEIRKIVRIHLIRKMLTKT